MFLRPGLPGPAGLRSLKDKIRFNFIRKNEIRNDDSGSEDEEDLLNINTEPPKAKKKGKKAPCQVDEQGLLNRLADVILQICINRNFEGDYAPKGSMGYVSLSSAILSIVQDNSREFTKLVSKMFQDCDLEDSGMELQGWH